MGCLAIEIGGYEGATCAANDNYTFNGLNQIATKNGTAFSYDARGNLTSDGVKSYVYNSENMLTSSTQAGVTSTLTYDAQNRLASITKSGITTKFIYDGTDLIAEYDGNNNLFRKYVHGGGIDEPLVWYEGAGTADKRFIISDHQGNVIATTNAAGSVLNISTYSPYGERTNTNAAYASRFGYTGQADLPEINLQNYKARMYDPRLGRFLQTDPVGYDAGMNLYAYVSGDPINHIDPKGLLETFTVTGRKLTDFEKCEKERGRGNCLGRNGASYIANTASNISYSENTLLVGGADKSTILQQCRKKHNDAVKDFKNQFEALGLEVVENVYLRSPTGTYAIADLVVKFEDPMGFSNGGSPSFRILEVKTGTPKFSKNQVHVYSLIRAGLPVIPFGNAAEQIGLVTPQGAIPITPKALAQSNIFIPGKKNDKCPKD